MAVMTAIILNATKQDCISGCRSRLFPGWKIQEILGANSPRPEKGCLTRTEVKGCSYSSKTGWRGEGVEGGERRASHGGHHLGWSDAAKIILRDRKAVFGCYRQLIVTLCNLVHHSPSDSLSYHGTEYMINPTPCAPSCTSTRQASTISISPLGSVQKSPDTSSYRYSTPSLTRATRMA